MCAADRTPGEGGPCQSAEGLRGILGCISVFLALHPFFGAISKMLRKDEMVQGLPLFHFISKAQPVLERMNKEFQRPSFLFFADQPEHTF